MSSQYEENYSGGSGGVEFEPVYHYIGSQVQQWVSSCPWLDAEALHHDVALIVWQRMQKQQQTTDSWIRSCVRWDILDALKHLRVRDRILQSVSRLSKEAEDVFEQHEFLWSVLEALPQKNNMRDITLMLFMGSTQQEISVSLNIPHRTLRRRLEQIRIIVKDFMVNDTEDAKLN